MWNLNFNDVFAMHYNALLQYSALSYRVYQTYWDTLYYKYCIRSKKVTCFIYGNIGKWIMIMSEESLQYLTTSAICILYVFSDIFFNMVIRRKPLFYIVNLIIPCVGIFYLSILVFYLPAQSKQKTALVIAILVSQTLYFTLIIEVIPATSLTLPLLGR